MVQDRAIFSSLQWQSNSKTYYVLSIGAIFKDVERPIGLTHILKRSTMNVTNTHSLHLCVSKVADALFHLAFTEIEFPV